jgi:hypothetical protein
MNSGTTSSWRGRHIGLLQPRETVTGSGDRLTEAREYGDSKNFSLTEHIQELKREAVKYKLKFKK